jgi:calcium binding protein 39
MMLRSCALHPELVVCMLDAGFATELLMLAQHQTFDISSDAFASLRELLLTHKSVAATYLETYFKMFFARYNKLLQTEDYVTKRQALRLLGEILLNRDFKDVMLQYVGEEQFLQVQMNLLRDHSKAIQVDAFHIFKVFAASPNKRTRVHQILFKNRDRLVRLVESLGKGDDGSFQQDQKAVIGALWALEALPAKNQSPRGRSTSW